jgi:hypothetical protein
MLKIYCRLSWLLRDDIFFSGAADGKLSRSQATELYGRCLYVTLLYKLNKEKG